MQNFQVNFETRKRSFFSAFSIYMTVPLIDTGVCFWNRSPKVKIFISGILPRDECYSVNRLFIEEINTILKCKCAFHRFNFIEQEQGWTDNNDALDHSLFYQDKLHLIQIESIKLSQWIKTATEDVNIGQNTPFNEMTNKKHNQFTKTYKMAVSFKLNHTDFTPLLNSTVSKPVSSVSFSLSCTTASRFFSNKVSALSFKSRTKASNKSFPGATRFCPGNFALKHLQDPSNRSYLILLITFQLNSNIKLFVNLLCRLNSLLLI